MKITRRDFIRESVLLLLGLVTRDVPRLPEPPTTGQQDDFVDDGWKFEMEPTPILTRHVYVDSGLPCCDGPPTYRGISINDVHAFSHMLPEPVVQAEYRDSQVFQFGMETPTYSRHVYDATGQWTRVGPDETILGRWETPKSTSMLVHYIDDEDLDA